MDRDSSTNHTVERREPSARLHRPAIKDPKLILGILLITISIIGVIAVIQLNNQTTQYYAAKSDIRIGEKISADMLTPVDANMGSATKNYISADEVKKGDLVAKRQIPAGDILTKSSTATDVREGRRLVTVSIDRGAASTFKTGEHVDMWVSQNQTSIGSAQNSTPGATGEGNKNKEDSANDQSAQPTTRERGADVQNAEISSITVEESVLGANGKATVQLWVDEDAVSTVVHATSNDSKITLVPIALGEGK